MYVFVRPSVCVYIPSVVCVHVVCAGVFVRVRHFVLCRLLLLPLLLRAQVLRTPPLMQQANTMFHPLQYDETTEAQ